MEEKTKLKNIKISGEIHAEFTKIQGELQSISGKQVSQDNALKILIERYRSKKK